MPYRTINLRFGERSRPCELAVAGERHATELVVDVRDVQDGVPNASFFVIASLPHRADNASHMLPVAGFPTPLTPDDGALHYLIDGALTSRAGLVSLEFWAKDGDTLVKSWVYQFHVSAGLGNRPIGAPSDTIDKILNAGLDAQKAIELLHELSDRIDNMIDDVMRMSVYDVDGSGIVDDAERLGGLLPGDYAKAADIPTDVAQLGNNADYQSGTQVRDYVAGLGYQTAAQVAAYVETLDYQTADEVEAAIAAKLGIHVKFMAVDTLPDVGEEYTIYLVPNTDDSDNVKDEYYYIDGQWDKIGSTEADLTGYVKDEDLADYARRDELAVYAKADDVAAQFVPMSRKLNNLDLSQDRSLTAADVGAVKTSGDQTNALAAVTGLYYATTEADAIAASQNPAYADALIIYPEGN